MDTDSTCARSVPPASSEIRQVGLLLGVTLFLSGVLALTVWPSVLGLTPLRAWGPVWVFLTAGVTAAVGAGVWRCCVRTGGTALFLTGPAPDRVEFAVRLAVLSCVGLLVAFWLFVGFVFPQYGHDGYAFRTPAMHGWLQAGRVHWVSGVFLYSNAYYFNVDCLSAAVAALVGSSHFLNWTQVAIVLAGGLAVSVMCRLVSVHGCLAAVAGGLWVAVPLHGLQAHSQYTDSAVSSLFVVALCWMLVVIRLHAEPTGWPIRVMAWLAFGLSLGVAAGSKGNMLAFAPVLMAAALVFTWRRRDHRAVVGLFCLAGLCVVVAGGYWPLRTLWVHGNPTWPLHLEVLGIPLFGGQYPVASVMDIQIPPQLLGWAGPLRPLVAWLQVAGPAAVYDDRVAGLGYAWPFVAAPLSVLTAGRSLRRWKTHPRWPLVAVLCGVVLACFLIQPARWWSRYTLWLWGPGLVCSAVAIQAFRVRRRVLAHVLLVLLCAGLVVESTFVLLRCDLNAALRVRLQGRVTHERALAGVWALSFPLDSPLWRAWDEAPCVARGYWHTTRNYVVQGLLSLPLGKRRIIVVPDPTWPAAKKAFFACHSDYLFLDAFSPALDDAKRDPDVKLIEFQSPFLALLQKTGNGARP